MWVKVAKIRLCADFKWGPVVVVGRSGRVDGDRGCGIHVSILISKLTLRWRYEGTRLVQEGLNLHLRNLVQLIESINAARRGRDEGCRVAASRSEREIGGHTMFLLLQGLG